MTHSSDQLVERDLRNVCSSLKEEFEKLAGRRLLVTGGAGFLGYYLIQAPLFWNREARAEAEKLLSNREVDYIDDLGACIEGVEAILLMTRWPEFQSLPELPATQNPQPLVVDGRRMLDKREIERYEGIGL